MGFFKSAGNWWDKNGFQILVIGSIFLILIIWFLSTRKNKMGNYTKGILSSIYMLGKDGPEDSYQIGKFGKKKKRNNKKSEKEVRKLLEYIFPGELFPSVRPSFLRNPETGKNLEIDMYNKSLNLAIEYQGIQHYQFTPHFHKTTDDFISQQKRDKLKKELLAHNGIDLIEIPYDEKDVKGLLCSELRKLSRLEPYLSRCF